VTLGGLRGEDAQGGGAPRTGGRVGVPEAQRTQHLPSDEGIHSGVQELLVGQHRQLPVAHRGLQRIP